MEELAAFVEARLAEDEATAKACESPSPWKAAEDEHDSWIVTYATGQPLVYDEGTPTLNEAEHIARHDPARVLREVTAKRRILARWEFARNQVTVGAVNEGAGYGPADPGWPLRADSHELDVRDLAAAWSDHPDYRPEWVPSA